VGFLFAGLLLLVLKHIPLETMIFLYWKRYGTRTVIPIWEFFLLTQFLGKLFFFFNIKIPLSKQMLVWGVVYLLHAFGVTREALMLVVQWVLLINA
jgi:hypothetical protein